MDGVVANIYTRITVWLLPGIIHTQASSSELSVAKDLCSCAESRRARWDRGPAEWSGGSSVSERNSMSCAIERRRLWCTLRWCLIEWLGVGVKSPFNPNTPSAFSPPYVGEKKI